MIHTLPTGMQVHWRRHEVLANNLANVSTAGYKQDDLVVAGEGTPPSEVGFQMVGMTPIGMHSVSQWTDFSPGPIRETGRAMDIALDGTGFFAVQTPEGVRYTRAGGFTMDRDGFLSTPSGHRVLGAGGPISVRSTRFEVSTKGEVQDDGRVVDTLRIVDFPKPYRLQKQGDGLFAPVDAAAVPSDATDVQVMSGSLEGSNVDPVRTMVSMIEMLRSYESAQRAIQSADETERRANEMGRA